MMNNEIQFKQREFDGKWERLVLIPDYANKYEYETESGNKMSYIPTRWVVSRVYDYMMEIES